VSRSLRKAPQAPRRCRYTSDSLEDLSLGFQASSMNFDTKM
jgi:hypothetical protein